MYYTPLSLSPPLFSPPSPLAISLLYMTCIVHSIYINTRNSHVLVNVIQVKPYYVYCPSFTIHMFESEFRLQLCDNVA